MKRTILVVVLALALTFAFSATASATTGKFFTYGTGYYKWEGGSRPADAFSGYGPTAYVAGTTTPGGFTSPSDTEPGTATAATTRVPYSVSLVGSNPENPGAHANYLATTAKCGMCHSVHRAVAGGVKLLPTANATCSGCHVGSTAVTAKIITWRDVDLDWVPAFEGDEDPAAGGGGGPHNDPVWDTVLPENGWTVPYPLPSYELEPFSRYGCFTRRCHATNPHGANSSKYKIFSAKLLFNNTPAQDASEAGTTTVPTYGGWDAVYDDLGATDAAVQRFLDYNDFMTADADGDIFITDEGTTTARALTAGETHALVAGLTCGRPCVGESVAGVGEDECHAEAVYSVIDKRVVEWRNHGTGTITGTAIRTDNTQHEGAGFGGNDNRDLKTGHVAGTFAIGDSEWAPISGCTGCHDQTDTDNTVAGNFTFPHGQTATGDTNLYLPSGTMATGVRVRIWAGYAGSLEDTLTTYANNYANQKAFDGQCLKCHRSGSEGVGLTY